MDPISRSLTIRQAITNIMSDWMRQDRDVEPPDQFEGTPFEGYHRLDNNSKVDQFIEQAESALRYLEQNGTATDRDLRRAAIDYNNSQILMEGRFAIIAPLLASADGVRWNGSYSLAVDAPDHGRSEWLDITSDFEIPDTRGYDGVPTAISHAYRHLEKTTRQNGGPRPVHPKELQNNAGVYMPDPRYGRAWEYLARIPGVDGPDADAPTWELVDRAEADESAEASA